MSAAVLERVPEDMALGRSKVLLLLGKGGGGKTSTAIHLALAALRRKLRVAIIDLDAQKCSETWRKIRGGGDVPVSSMTAAEAVAFIKSGQAQVYDLLIIDCGKDPSAHLGELVGLGDFALVPMRPSFLDLSVTLEWIKWLRAHQTSYAVVLNAAPPRRRLLNQPAGISPAIQESPLVRQVRAVLNQRTVALWRGQITHLHGIIEAMSVGRGLVEVAPNHPVSQEIDQLLDAVLRRFKITEDPS